MASDAQETLYRIFAELAGVPAAGGGSGPGGGLASGAIGSAISAATSSDDKGGGAAQVALNVMKSGLGVVPLVAALFGLFGGGGEEKPGPLVKYALPERREFQAAATTAGFAEVDYDQWGAPRVYERRASSGAAFGSTAQERASSGPAGGAAATERLNAGGSPQITVNVQAMDARSFLDRSSEIAAAVREAMLNLNSINDVVTDL